MAAEDSVILLPEEESKEEWGEEKSDTVGIEKEAVRDGHAEACWWVPVLLPCCTWSDMVLEELDGWFGTAWPLSVAFMARLAIEVMDLAFVGHLGTKYLAAASLATMWTETTSAWVWQGFSGAINVLSSNARGANNRPLIGVWWMLASWVMLVLCVPIAIAFWFTPSVMEGLGFQDGESELAGTYARYFALQLPPFFLWVAANGFLQGGLQLTYPALVVNLTCLGLNFFLNAILIHGPQFFSSSASNSSSSFLNWSGLGFIGSPLATATTRWLSLAFLFLFMGTCGRRAVCSALPTPRQGVKESCSWRRFRELTIRQAAPLVVGNLLEDIQLQVIAFMAAGMGQVQLAAHNSMLTLFFFATTLQWGGLKASTIRIGHYLGARDIARAKMVYWIHLSVAGIVAAGIAGFFIGAGEAIGHLFSSDPAVWEIFRELSILSGSGYIALSLFFSAVGLLQGQGRPSRVGIAFVVGAWLVAVPLAWLLGVHFKRGVLGLWEGLVGGYLVITAIASYFVYTSDWEKLADEAVARSAAIPEDGKEGEGGIGPSAMDELMDPLIAATPGPPTTTEGSIQEEHYA